METYILSQSQVDYLLRDNPIENIKIVKKRPPSVVWLVYLLLKRKNVYSHFRPKDNKPHLVQKLKGGHLREFNHPYAKLIGACSEYSFVEYSWIGIKSTILSYISGISEPIIMGLVKYIRELRQKTKGLYEGCYVDY